MDENPFQPPQCDLDEVGSASGDSPMPWENPARFPRIPDRIVQTLKCLLDPAEAGKALGGSRALLPAVTFAALVGMPLMWISQVLVAVFGPSNPMQGFFQLFGLPQPPPPTPEALVLQRVMQVAPAVLFPVTMALSISIWGLLVHGGLWATRALHPGRGLEGTLRTLLYSSSAFFLFSWILNLWVFLPPIAALSVFALSTLAWIAFGVYQGILLARTHETQTWRAILGFFSPWILLLCCCGGLGLFVAGMASLATMHR